MIFAKVTVKWFGKAPDIYNFNNIIESDLSFYDNIFWSRRGYADFTLRFAYDPTPKNVYTNSEIDRFSRWWHSFNKNTVPRIHVELFDGNNSNPIAKGDLFNWEENREDFEIVFTCIDEMNEILDQPVSRKAFIKYSESIEAKEQPSGPGEPPEGGVPPLNPPGLPTHSYHSVLQDFFWEALNEWWDSIRGDAPTFSFPVSLSPQFSGLGIMSSFVAPINSRLQQFNKGIYRVEIRLKKLSDIERKEILSDLSILTKSKVICNNGIHFIEGTKPVNITGYVQSINSNNDAPDIKPDRILERVSLQELWEDGWYPIANFTTDILKSRDDWQRNQIRPRTEYHIWGYSEPGENILTGVLQAGFQIRLLNQVYKIKEISYEAETIHNIKSFEAVCIRE